MCYWWNSSFRKCWRPPKKRKSQMNISFFFRWCCWCVFSLPLTASCPTHHAPLSQVTHTVTDGWLLKGLPANAEQADSFSLRLLVLWLATGWDWGKMEPMFNKQDSNSSEGDEKGWDRWNVMDCRSVRSYLCLSLMWTWIESRNW